MDQRLEELVRAAAACADLQPWALGPAGSAEALEPVVAAQQTLVAVQLRLVREVEAGGYARTVGATSTAAWLCEKFRMSIGRARRLVRVATALGRAPAPLRDAVDTGAVNDEQAERVLDALTEIPAEHADKAAVMFVDLAAAYEPRALGRLAPDVFHAVAPEYADEAGLAALARAEERQHRDRYLTIVPDVRGVGYRVRGRLTVEQNAVVQAVLDPLSRPAPEGAGDDRTPGQRRADALTSVCRLALNTTTLPDNGGDRPQVVVTTEYDIARRRLGYGTLDTGDRVTPSTVRRMCCDALVVPAVLDGDGLPLDVGRARRLFTGALRRALVLRDRGCASPGCDRPPRWADGHHVVHWEDGGATSLSNAVLLCHFHHFEIHRGGGWRVFIASDGLPTFVPPPWVDPEQRPRRNDYHRRQ